MIFNGLKGSDLVVYNYVMGATGRPLPISEIAHQTCYTHKTVWSSLNRLEKDELIERRRDVVPFVYQVLD